jgi:hypothetical protein
MISDSTTQGRLLLGADVSPSGPLYERSVPLFDTLKDREIRLILISTSSGKVEEERTVQSVYCAKYSSLRGRDQKEYVSSSSKALDAYAEKTRYQKDKRV